MKKFHSTELTRELQKVIDLVLNSVQEGEPLKVKKGFIDDLFTGGFDTIEVSNLFFVYSNEQKRNEDFETLKDYISLPESKEIKTQEIEVMVKVTFVAGTEWSNSELMEIAKNRVHIDLLSNVTSSGLEYIQSEVHSLKEEAEIYGNH